MRACRNGQSGLLHFTRAMIVLLGLWCVAPSESNAGEFDDLEGSRESKDFTPAERALFTEATDWFQRYEIKLAHPARSPLHWLDNDHLAFSTRAFAGWTAGPEELPRILTLNVTTGELKDSGYRGVLSCLNHQGDMLIRLEEYEEGVVRPKSRDRWLGGRWGQPLHAVEREPDTFTAYHLCRFHPGGFTINLLPPSKITENTFRTMPLLEKHGHLRVQLKAVDNKISEHLYLVKPDGSSAYLTADSVTSLFFFYQPWDERYFSNSTLSGPIVIDPKGHAEIQQTPRLLKYWTADNSGSVTGTRTKAGSVWTLKHGWSWRKQGLYLEKGKMLFRVDAGSVYWSPSVSPGGCRIFMNVSPGDPYSSIANYQKVVLDLCERKNK